MIHCHRAQVGGELAGAAPAADAAELVEAAALAASLSAYWEQHATSHGKTASGSGKELYRVFCHAVFKLRSDANLPLLVLASIPDESWMLVLCRDCECQRDGTFLSGLPGLKGGDIVRDWPLHDFPGLVEPPAVRCHRAGCATTTMRGPPDKRLSAPYVGHKSEAQKARSRTAKIRARQRWMKACSPSPLPLPPPPARLVCSVCSTAR